VSATRKPDRLLQEATAQARALRLQQQATLDAKVKRAHEGGATDSDMARELKVSTVGVKASRERQGLPPNREALFGGFRKAVAS
jgi:hypothetical protein